MTTRSILPIRRLWVQRRRRTMQSITQPPPASVTECHFVVALLQRREGGINQMVIAALR
jgi:hypothetical protein